MPQQKLKHIIITSLDMYLMGGVERTNSSLAKLFLEKGHKVTLISLFRNSEKPFFDFGDSEIITINQSPHGFVHNLPIKIKTIFGFFKMINYLKSIDDDYIVISSFLRTSILFGLFFNKRSKVIAHEHSSFSAHGLFISRLRLFAYKFLKCVICLTDHDKEIFRKNNIKSFKIPNFSKFKKNPVPYNHNENNLKCLSAGRLHTDKGFDRLLLIADKLRDENIIFNIIGSGSEKEKLKDLINKLNLTGIVNLTPASTNLEKHIDNCDLYLMTSRTEAAPLVLLEALAYSKPIVAYDCPIGVREIVSDGENGFLIDNGDIDEYVKKVKEILHSNETYDQLSIGASTYSQNHSPDSNYLLWSEHI